MRKQNAESQRKERKDKAMKKLLKKMAYDREKHEKQDKNSNDVRKYEFNKSPLLSQIVTSIKWDEILTYLTKSFQK